MYCLTMYLISGQAHGWHNFKELIHIGLLNEFPLSALALGNIFTEKYTNPSATER